MQLNLRRTLEIRLRDAVASLTPAKLLSLLLVIVVPGGLLVPLCYGAYEAARRAFGR